MATIQSEDGVEYVEQRKAILVTIDALKLQEQAVHVLVVGTLPKVVLHWHSKLESRTASRAGSFSVNMHKYLSCVPMCSPH